MVVITYARSTTTPIATPINPGCIDHLHIFCIWHFRKLTISQCLFFKLYFTLKYFNELKKTTEVVIGVYFLKRRSKKHKNMLQLHCTQNKLHESQVTGETTYTFMKQQ